MSILSSCDYEKGKQVRVQRNNINKRKACVLNYIISLIRLNLVNYVPVLLFLLFKSISFFC